MHFGNDLRRAGDVHIFEMALVRGADERLLKRKLDPTGQTEYLEK
jgi:hypothetical protein